MWGLKTWSHGRGSIVACPALTISGVQATPRAPWWRSMLTARSTYQTSTLITAIRSGWRHLKLWRQTYDVSYCAGALGSADWGEASPVPAWHAGEEGEEDPPPGEARSQGGGRVSSQRHFSHSRNFPALKTKEVGSNSIYIAATNYSSAPLLKIILAIILGLHC